jgi:transmembrane sensor
VVRVARTPGDASVDAQSGMADAVQLHAGEQLVARADGQLSPVVAVPSEGIAPWRESRVSFVNTPLVQALAELERYGSTGLAVHDRAVAELRLSGTFDPRDPQTLRQALPSALPVRLQQREAGTAEVVLAR